MMLRRALTASVAFALLGVAPVSAQDADGNGIRLPGSLRTTEPPDVPFGPGEDLLYQVKLGIFSVGEGHLRVLPVDTVRGRRTYPLELTLNGSAFFGAAKVRDLFQSWMDVHTLSSLRFRKDQHELSYKSQKWYEIYPERQEWDRAEPEIDESGPTISEQPLDEIAFLFFIRTLDLEVGEEYTFNNYFKEDGNPVVLRVLRREVKEVPAGTFRTIVVQPIIQTDGLFSEGGEAEVYLTDDDERHIIHLRSNIPVMGSLSLNLKEIRDPSSAGLESRVDSGG
jgi:hypothetical protein